MPYSSIQACIIQSFFSPSSSSASPPQSSVSFIWGAGCKTLINKKCQIVPLFRKYLYKFKAEDLHMKVLRQNPTIHTFCDLIYNGVIWDSTVLMVGLLVMVWERLGDISQNSWWAGWDSTRTPAKYKSRVLPLKPHCKSLV